MATTTTAAPPAGSAATGRWIEDWRPEDVAFWESIGRRVARRNLVLSICTEHIGFSVWSLWSVLVLFLTPAYGFSTDPRKAAAEKFLLTTLPTALGAVVRVPYTFAVARFGGRNWTVLSATLLLVPMPVAAFVVRPGVSYGTLLWVAALAGVGGGNFASSMANINAFYPQRLKGAALGLNAGAARRSSRRPGEQLEVDWRHRAEEVCLTGLRRPRKAFGADRGCRSAATQAIARPAGYSLST